MRLLIPVAAAVAIAIGVLVVWSSVEDSSGKAEVSRAVDPSTEGEARDVSSGRVESRVDRPPGDSDEFVKRAQEVLTMPPDAEREKGLRELAQDWAMEDPTAAEQWAASLELTAERERALTHVCLKVAEMNPRDAASIAQWHRLHEGVLEAVASRWADADFDAAAAWASGFSNEELRERVLSRLAMARAGTAPHEAAVIVSESLAPGEVQEEAAMAVLHQWLLKDADAARQWVEVFPEGPLKERAMAEISGMMSYRERLPDE